MPANETKQIKKENLIAHAGGKINNDIYTNSYEAIIKSIKNGYNYIEIDLRKTTDNVLVGIHEWEDIEKFLKTSIPESKKEYFKKKVLSHKYNYKDIKILNNYLKYTIIDEFQIEKIFSKNKDLILVTDKIKDYKKLTEAFSFNDRIIIEVIGITNYIKSFFYNFKQKNFSTDLSFYDRFFIYIFNIKGIIVDKSVLKNKNKKEYLEKYISDGKEVFMFTINDFEFINKIIGKSATRFYTDQTN